MIDPRTKKGFDRLGNVINKSGARGRGFIDRVFSRWIPMDEEEPLDWVGDADWARIQQEPVRARALLKMFGITIALLLIWAAIAPLDEVTRGAGKVIPSSRLQVIESLDGGVVEEIVVHEGDIVKAGDLLMRIDPTRYTSSLQEKQYEVLSLIARAARLRALAEDTPLELPEEELKAVPQIVRHEKHLYEESRREFVSQMTIMREQLSQKEHELEEVQARRIQSQQAYGLAAQELSKTAPLLTSGAVSEVEVIRLKRDVANARGERDAALARKATLERSVEEARERVQETELNSRNKWRNELADVLSKIASMSQGTKGLADRVLRAEIISPVNGTVQRLYINTLGGVVQPAGRVADVVPLGDSLEVEVKVSPKDIAFVFPGQKALVKLTAYEFAIYGGLEADVYNISPDTVTDEQGNTFYLVRVKTHKSSIGKGFPIIPGMMAQVDILTGKRTVLMYLLKPILRGTSNAMKER
ncbi:secretion protein HylD [Prosthecochloris sp. ZM]|uniref:HlyD family type I secretion periplasmic adaptor subunit n=1 Tax=Prosthecochloris sp. ZM TaxID=2283143 RepID=UPI000DF77604|nr:HlyD family type I secretion periplasmic adaptor subunit [Prosthecochloris sp. ZM]RDD30655.1 secretion protein HylD [Prosthecochloris sp. ZM]